MKWYKKFLCCLYVLFLVFFQGTLLGNVWNNVEKAFPVTITHHPDEPIITFNINVENGYYVYVDSIDITGDFEIKSIQKSEAKVYQDPYFGEQEIWDRPFFIRIQTAQKKDVRLQFTLQGCKKNGPCLPPYTRSFQSNGVNNFSQITAKNNNSVHESSDWLNGLEIGLIFLAGLFMFVNPCSLPILGTLFIWLFGQKIPKHQKIVQIVAYGLGLGMCYFLLMLLMGYMGEWVQRVFQNQVFKWIVVLSLVGLAFLARGNFRWSGAGLGYKLQDKIASTSSGVMRSFLLGFSNLFFISACAAPVLLGVTAQFGINQMPFSWLLQSSVWFALGGILPFLVLCFVGQRFVPSGGSWLLILKRITSYVLLILAFWNMGGLLDRYIIESIWLVLSVFFAIDAWFLFKKNTVLFRRAWLVFLITVMLLTGLFFYFGILTTSAQKPPENLILTDDSRGLQNELSVVKKPTVVLLYADWCVSCLKEKMFLFSRSILPEGHQKWRWVMLDITKMNEDHVRFLEDYQQVGPPAILLFNRKGVLLQRSFSLHSINGLDDLNTLTNEINRALIAP